MSRASRTPPSVRLLVGLALAAGAIPARAAVLVEIKQLRLQQIQARTFTLPSEQTVRLHGVLFQRTELFGELSRAWILESRSRRVVWESTQAKLTGRTRETRKFESELTLPAGTFEVYYSTHPDRAWQFDEDLAWWEMVRTRGLDIDDYRDNVYQLKLTIEGTGNGGPLDLAARRQDPRTVVDLTRPGANARLARGFSLAQPADVEVYCIGELSEDGGFDYGWIVDTRTRKQIWGLDWRNSEPAGGARKNRRGFKAFRLPAGSYAAFYVSDDSHGPDKWNSQPPNDPLYWGLTVRVRNPQQRGLARVFAYQDPADVNVIVALTRMQNSEHREKGFTLKEAAQVRVYAIGEGSDGEMFDYGWIVDARTRNKIWAMRFAETQNAGGASKNRVADTVLELPAGSYLVTWVSDGSHSFARWNSTPPTDRDHWGITVSGVGEQFSMAKVAPYSEAEASGRTLAQLVKIGDEQHKKQRFTLPQSARVRIVAMGEGRDGKMYDYGWIADSSGRPVWEMSYRTTDAAGGSTKNRIFQGTVQLAAGEYVAHFVSDDSHSFEDWNDDPPRNPEGWGMVVSLLQ